MHRPEADANGSLAPPIESHATPDDAFISDADLVGVLEEDVRVDEYMGSDTMEHCAQPKHVAFRFENAAKSECLVSQEFEWTAYLVRRRGQWRHGWLVHWGCLAVYVNDAARAFGVEVQGGDRTGCQGVIVIKGTTLRLTTIMGEESRDG